MQEDRSSLFPEKMIWSCSVRPREDRTLNDRVTKFRVMGTGLAVVNLSVYNSLAELIFSGLVVQFVCILVSIVFVGTVHQILFETNSVILYLLVVCMLIVLGMMTYQVNFA